MLDGKRDALVTREKLVVAAVSLILRHGYHATGVEAICAEAGVTKGAFFHHFQNKDELGLAVIQWWSAMGTSFYSKAWADETADPLDQLDATLDIMEGFASRPDEPCICCIGMMAQELATTHPEIRASCGREFEVWTRNIAALLQKAKERRKPLREFDPEQVAWFLHSIWQGSMLLAKTRGEQTLILNNLKQARAYVHSFFRAKPSAPHRGTKAQRR